MRVLLHDKQAKFQGRQWSIGHFGSGNPKRSIWRCFLKYFRSSTPRYRKNTIFGAEAYLRIAWSECSRQGPRSHWISLAKFSKTIPMVKSSRDDFNISLQFINTLPSLWSWRTMILSKTSPSTHPADTDTNISSLTHHSTFILPKIFTPRRPLSNLPAPAFSSNGSQTIKIWSVHLTPPGLLHLFYLMQCLLHLGILVCFVPVLQFRIMYEMNY